MSSQNNGKLLAKLAIGMSPIPVVGEIALYSGLREVIHRDDSQRNSFQNDIIGNRAVIASIAGLIRNGLWTTIYSSIGSSMYEFAKEYISQRH